MGESKKWSLAERGATNSIRGHLQSGIYLFHSHSSDWEWCMNKWHPAPQHHTQTQNVVFPTVKCKQTINNHCLQSNNILRAENHQVKGKRARVQQDHYRPWGFFRLVAEDSTRSLLFCEYGQSWFQFLMLNINLMIILQYLQEVGARLDIPLFRMQI